MKPKTTLIAVADGTQAKFYLHDRPGEAIRPSPFTPMAIENPKTSEQGTDKPGRAINSVGGARSAMENPADWHQQAEERFARNVAARIETILGQEPNWRLILVAAPDTLGTLRQALSQQCRQRVVGELAKDYANTPEKRLNQALADLLPVG